MQSAECEPARTCDSQHPPNSFSDTIRDRIAPASVIGHLDLETQLLLCAAGMWESEDRRRRMMDLVSEGPDWNKTLVLARLNRVEPLLYWAFKDYGLPLREIEFRLHKAHLRCASMYMHQTQELKRLIALFQRNGIPALPLKGPLLAQRLYADGVVRASVDLDLLVKPEDVQRARLLLLADGYRHTDELCAGAFREAAIADCEWHFKSAKCHVELHWGLLPRAMGSISRSEFLWQDTVEQEFQDMTIVVPSDVATVRSLLLHHGVKHRWQDLLTICDLARAIERFPHVRWLRILKSIESEAAREAALVGFTLAERLLGARLPESLIGTIGANTKVLPQAAMALAFITNPERKLPGFATWRTFVNALAVHEPPARTSRQYAHYLRASLQPTFQDRLSLGLLPARLEPAYWMWRATRVLARHGLGVLQRIID